MKKRPRPFFRKPRGLWYIQIGSKQFNLGPDKAAARRQADDLLKEHYKPKVPSGTVVALLDRFLAFCKQDRAAKTFEWYFWRLDSFKNSLKNQLMQAADIGPALLDDWLTNHNWGRTMRHGCIRAVQRAFRFGVKHKLIDKSPIDDYEKPKPQKRTVVITLEEYTAILKHSRSAFRDLVILAWETGARPQELIRVETRHVDLTHSRWVFPPDESKGEEIARVVYLTDEALAITRKLMVLNPHGPLCRNSEGRPWNTDSVHCGFERLEKKVGKKHSLYGFRHTWATNALSNNVDSITVSVLMGHKDPSTLARTYQHVSQNPAYLRDSLNRASRRGA